MMVSIINVLSFNCRGFKSSEDYIKMLAKQADILALQVVLTTVLRIL